jgi:hypothetical protein
MGFPSFVLGWLWHQRDLPLQRVIGRTPEIHLEKRGAEIRQWLDDAPRRTKEHTVQRYAVLDDEVAPILEEIPAQSVFACEPWHGLTEEVANRVIRHLAGPEGHGHLTKSLKTGQNRAKRIR